jgi:hypothetical protein
MVPSGTIKPSRQQTPGQGDATRTRILRHCAPRSHVVGTCAIAAECAGLSGADLAVAGQLRCCHADRRIRPSWRGRLRRDAALEIPGERALPHRESALHPHVHADMPRRTRQGADHRGPAGQGAQPSPAACRRLRRKRGHGTDVQVAVAFGVPTRSSVGDRRLRPAAPHLPSGSSSTEKATTPAPEKASSSATTAADRIAG